MCTLFLQAHAMENAKMLILTHTVTNMGISSQYSLRAYVNWNLLVRTLLMSYWVGGT